jgi:hypothetical protein
MIWWRASARVAKRRRCTSSRLIDAKNLGGLLSKQIPVAHIDWV